MGREGGRERERKGDQFNVYIDRTPISHWNDKA